MNSVFLRGKEVFYEIRPSRRARRLGLTVYPGGRLVLTLPEKADLTRIPRFIHAHSAWIERSVRRFAHKKKLPGGVKDYKENREKALALIQERLEHFNTHYRLKYGKVTVRDSRTRWGSCSKKGNLNFSYKLVHLSPELCDYVVVHELAHLKHFDHSPEFWATVAETIPSYKALRRELRTLVH